MKRSASLAVVLLVAAGLAATAEAQPQRAVTAEWFAGTWADRPDCSGRVHFLRNGKFYTLDGNEGRWRLEGSEVVLTAVDGAGVRRMPVVRLDQNRLRSGQVVSYRCEGRSTATSG